MAGSISLSTVCYSVSFKIATQGGCNMSPNERCDDIAILYLYSEIFSN